MTDADLRRSCLCLLLCPVLGLGAAACATGTGADPAVLTAASHAWNGYHWGRTGTPISQTSPLQLQLLDNTSTQTWDGLLENVAADWSQSKVLDAAVVEVTPDKQCRPASGKIRVCNRKYGFNGWLGLAQIWLQQDPTTKKYEHIFQATAKVNDSYLNTSTYASRRRHVLCQEVGHDFGLDHQDAGEGSCMGSSSSLANTPNAHDYEQLLAIYDGHLDAAAAASTAMLDADPGEGPDRGQLLAATKGRSVYAKDLGGGVRLLTLVLWTDDGGPGN